MYIAGLDIGTSGTKITVYDENGNFVENHYEPYDSIHKDGYHEIDARVIIKAVEKVISETVNIPEALGLTSFGETFVLVDKDGNVLANSMLYTDPRGDISCFDKEETERIAGCSPHGMFSLPKLLWIKKNRPELYEKAEHVLLMQDFVGFVLTGNACIDYSTAARTMGLDIKNRKWSKEIFDRCGIDMSKMSTPVESGTVIGVSNKFGLKNTKIVAVCHDQVASAIGAGALTEGIAVDGSGSVECITPIFNKVPDGNDTFPIIPFIDGKYCCYAFSFTGGTALKWFRDNFAAAESYANLDKSIGDKPGEVLILPHFAGSATPYMDSESKALFANVTLETGKAELYRAVMEGVAYEMRINMDALNTIGIKPERLLATGGGSKSPVWLQIKADILGVPLTVIDAPEVGALGTIMITAKAVGFVDDVEKLRDSFVKEGKTYYPNNEMHKEYTEHYEKYKKMYLLAKELR